MEATAPPRDTAPPRATTDARDTGLTLRRPAIVALLYLLNIVLGISVFVGLVLAYVWRGDREMQAWEESHYTYLIRTFWIGFVAWLALMTLFFVAVFGPMAMGGVAENAAPGAGFFIGFFGFFILGMVLAVWFCIRSVLSLVRAGDLQPIPNPRTWLF